MSRKPAVKKTTTTTTRKKAVSKTEKDNTTKIEEVVDDNIEAVEENDNTLEENEDILEGDSEANGNTDKDTEEAEDIHEHIRTDLETVMEMIKKNDTNSENSARNALNFISGLNVILSNETENRAKRIQNANYVIEELSKLDKLLDRAASMVNNWAGNDESLNAYLAVISMSVAKKSDRLKDMPKNGIIAKFTGKFLGMGQIMTECS